MVNTSYEVSVLDALKGCENVILDTELLKVYEEWIAAQPKEEDYGWASEPWSMPEMPLDESFVKEAAAKSEVALITIARTVTGTLLQTRCDALPRRLHCTESTPCER